MSEQKKAPQSEADNSKRQSNNSTLNKQSASELLRAFNCCFLRSDLPKVPEGKDWPNNPRMAKDWNGQGVGVICGKGDLDESAVQALDFDTLNNDLAQHMRDYMRQLLQDRGGVKLARVGLPPKWLLPFKLPEAMPKEVTPALYPNGVEDKANKNQLEILGLGQQFVAYNIHPDTQEPYQWFNLDTGKPDNLHGKEPDDLVELTRTDLDAIKAEFNRKAAELGLKPDPKLEKAKTAPQRKFKASSGDAGIIDKVCEQTALVDVLMKHNYKPQSETRLLFHGSTTGVAGVVLFEDENGKERCYSHHSGDPLANGHSHDVFSVIVELEFRGDVSAAVAHFAPIVDPEGQAKRQREHMEQQNSVDVGDFTEFEKSAKKPKAFTLPDYPPELLNLPHMLGELQAFIVGRMTYPSIATAGVAAIATMTAFAQSNLLIKSRDGLGFNEFYMILAPTGFGKEDLRRPVEILHKKSAEATTLEYLAEQRAGNLQTLGGVTLRHAAPASAQGIHEILEANRSTFFLSDEFAEWLRETGNNAQKQAALGYLMQAYTKATGTLEPGHAVTRKYTPVERPRLSILATSTAEAMFHTMTREHADSGAYNRWFMFVGDQVLPQKRYEGLVYDPEPALVEFIAWLKLQGSAGNDKQVTFSADGWQAFMKLDQALAEPIKREDALLGGRLAEQAIKLAALIALSDKRFEMQPKDLETAFNIRVGLYHRAAALARHEGSMDGLHATGQALQQVAAYFEKAQGEYRSQLAARSRKYKALSLPERKAVVEALLSDGIVAVCKDNPKYLVSLVYRGE